MTEYSWPELYNPTIPATNQKEEFLAISEELLSHRSSFSCHTNQESIHSFNSIHSIGDTADLNRENVSKYEFEVFEAETPSRGVSSVFICLYSVLGEQYSTVQYTRYAWNTVKFEKLLTNVGQWI